MYKSNNYNIETLRNNYLKIEMIMIFLKIVF